MCGFCIRSNNHLDIVEDIIDFGVFGKYDLNVSESYDKIFGEYKSTLSIVIVGESDQDLTLYDKQIPIKFCPMCGRNLEHDYDMLNKGGKK